MKPMRNIIILCVVIVLLAVGLFAVLKYEPESEEDVTQNTAVTVYQTNSQSIVCAVVTHPEGTYKLVKENGTWALGDRNDLPLSQARINSMLFACANVTAEELIEENATNLSVYGLDTPERVVTMQEADGKTTTICIGRTDMEGKYRYITVNDKTKVYSKSADSCDALAMSLSDLLDTVLYELEAEEIVDITMQYDGADTVVLKKVDEAWQMQSPISKAGNQYAIDNELLPYIKAVTAAKTIAVPQEGVDYGFASPRASYTVKTADGAEYSVTVGKDDGTMTYVKLAGRSCIYQVVSDNLGFVSLNYLDLANKLLHVENLKDLKEISVTGFEKDYHITVSGYGADGTYSVNGREVNSSKFIKVYQSIIGLSLDGYTNAGTSSNQRKTIRFLRNDGAEHILSCYPLDERNYMVTVDGAGKYIVRKKQFDTMISQLNSLIP